MPTVTIRDSQSLIAAVSSMHDCGFEISDCIYDSDKKTASLNAKEYVYKGKLVQKKTAQVKTQHQLTLAYIDNCEITTKDKKGYQAVGEDYINSAEIEGDTLIIRSSFHDFHLTFSKIDGELVSYDA